MKINVTHVTHHLAELMQFVKNETVQALAFVCPNILAILTQVVDQNAFSIMTVQETKLVSAINVKTRAQALAE